MKLNPARCESPVLFLVFNRPDVTRRVFERIRQAKPGRLYIAADGPRKTHLDDAHKTAEVRRVVAEVDWSCEVQTLFRDENLGCGRAVKEAIDWFFEHEEQGIILEDDCLPHLDFFRFCDELLEYYAHDERVSVITGDNFQGSRRWGDASYYFSKYNHCWGWATWRHAWQYNDLEIKFWPHWKRSRDWTLKMPDRIERHYWEKIFDRVYHHQIDSWAYPWTACTWRYGGLTATPNVNLVSNIGFGPDATHTTCIESSSLSIGAKAIGMITHPQSVVRIQSADRYVFNHHFHGKYLRFPRVVIAGGRGVLGALRNRIRS